MDTGEVKIGKTGNGIPKMSYTQKVADFNTFIKSPEKFIKGMSVKTTDKVSAKTGDKDYKQLLGKVKMIGEKVSTLTAEVIANPSAEKTTALNEAIAELNATTALLVEFEAPAAQAQTTEAPVAEGDWKAKITAKINEYVNKLPQDKKDVIKTELETKLHAEDEAQVQAVLQPNEAKAQAEIDKGQEEAKVTESFVVEGFLPKPGSWLDKAITGLFTGIELTGALGFIVSTIAWAATNGYPGEMVKLIGEAGGIVALVAFILHGVYAAVNSGTAKA